MRLDSASHADLGAKSKGREVRHLEIRSSGMQSH